MSAEDELAFLKAHLGELSPAVLRQLKRDFVAKKKRREAEVAAKAKASGKRPTGQHRGRQPGSAGGGGENSVSQKAPRATARKRKANEFDSSDSGGSMEPATRCPAPGPLSGAGSAPLPAQAKGSSVQGPVVKSTAYTGEQAASGGRKLSYAEAEAAYAGVDSSAPLPAKKGSTREGKGGRDEKASRGTSALSKFPRGEKDVTVGTTAGGHLGDHPAAPKKPSGKLKPTAKGTSTAPVPAASMKAAQRRTYPGASGDVSGPLSVAPIGTTSSTAQVDKVVPHGERRNKTPVYVS
jgi:hypothetical protein